jgi:hypothetical protein
LDNSNPAEVQSLGSLAMIILFSTSLLFIIPFRIMGCTWPQAVFQLVSIWAMLFLVYLTYIVLKA